MDKKEKMVTRGWVYCLSNPSFPHLLKIGQTKTTPQQRATQLYTTGVPTPFKVELAKYVNGHEKKEKTIHRLLEKFSIRINAKREFFEIKLEEVKEVFDLLDGEDFSKEILEKVKKEVYVERVELNLINHLIDGQKIRHQTEKKYLEGIYNIKMDKISFGNSFYSPREFVSIHNSRLGKKDKMFLLNDFEIEVDGKWLSLQSLI